MDDERFDELKQAARPTVDFLRKYYNLECQAIISCDRADIVSRELGVADLYDV